MMKVCVIIKEILAHIKGHLIVKVIILWLMMCGVAYGGGVNDFLVDNDLTLPVHVAVGAGVSYGVYKLTEDRFEPWQVVLLQIGSTFAVGCLIESFDRNWDWQDVGEYSVPVIFMWEF